MDSVLSRGLGLGLRLRADDLKKRAIIL